MVMQNDRYLSTHPALAFGGGRSKKAWLNSILAPVLPQDKKVQILEVGPGHGEALQLLSQDIGYENVTAIDVSSEVVEHCKRVTGVSVELVADPICYLASRENQYDLILMYHVLEHIPRANVVPTLEAINHALKAGGVLIVGVPNAASPIIGIEQHLYDFTHQVAFSPWSLEQVHRLAGFQRCRVAPVWPPSHGIVRVAQRVIQRCILSVMRLYLRVFTGVQRPILTHTMVCYAWK